MAIALVAFVLALQWPLVLNPGYFSHDELQWAAAADVASGQRLPWVSWLGVDAFQYRPLTFNLWLWLSHHLFARPHAFHAVFVAWGAINALLLQRVLRAWSVGRTAAVTASLVFALGPFAASVHGWVATLADLLWVGVGLLIALAALQWRRQMLLGACVFVLMALALLAKEAALSIPVLSLVACILDRDRRAWRVVLVATVLPALAYLALRYDAIQSGAASTTLYDWRLAYLPQRWLEYQLFGPMPSVSETVATLARGILRTRVLLAALLWCGLAVALARAGMRWLLAFILGGIAALGPVLVLAGAMNHYGYAFAAFTAGLVAASWPRLPRWGRVIAALLSLLLVWHGINVMRTIHHVGAIQSVFSPALARAATTTTGDVTLRLSPQAGNERWIYQRLTHDIPAYQGVPIGNRVRLVESGAADYIIAADGRLLPGP